MEAEKDFFEKVYKIVNQIPYGKVTTYGAISKALVKDLSHSRAVGYALNSNKYSFKSDSCHRVVNRLGELSGSVHFETPSLMKDLLESEGIEFINGKVNMSKHFWSPDESE